ncbi:male-enhanced antigen 1 [Huso huso]|uniref:Male-enhanced antigen 1 n=1 Tax=Huso huso TaxID=61971 RepID=A0ABR0ZWM0_HUSHU
MEVERAREMGPERIFPNAEEELGHERPPEGGGEWSEDELEEEVGVEVDEEEGAAGGGYYYQPLNQDPDSGQHAVSQTAQLEDTETQVQGIQERIQAMGLHLPHAPPPDSDEEEDPEEAVAKSSRSSIPMDPDHVELVKRTMSAINLPSLGIPSWAREISDDQWKDMVQQTIESRQPASALKLERK